VGIIPQQKPRGRSIQFRSCSTVIFLMRKTIFKENDEYVCKTAKTIAIEEAAQLIEAGFEYVTEINNIKLFRKRK
jgi:hypothetical protein